MKNDNTWITSIINQQLKIIKKIKEERLDDYVLIPYGTEQKEDMVRQLHRIEGSIMAFDELLRIIKVKTNHKA